MMAEKYDLISIFGANTMENFEDIDFETFVDLQPEHIKEAIPKLVPRIKFEKLFKSFLRKIEEDKMEVLKELNGFTERTNDIVSNLTNESDKIIISNFNSYEDPLFDQSLPSFNNMSKQASHSKEICNPPIHVVKQKTVLKTAQDIIDIPNIELKILITKWISTEHQQPLPNSDRVVIGKAIIHHLLVNNFERVINREEFIGLAELIVQLFPQEKKGTYYTPAVKNTQAQGKLISAYQKYKTPLREVGLITKRAKISRTEKEDYATGTVQLMKEKSDAFRFVLEESEDFEQIKDCWQFCFKERQVLLNQLSIFEYVRRFPSLNSAKGYELLTLDADTLHANKSSKLLEIFPKIFAYASQTKRLPLEAKTLLTAYNELSVDLEENSLKILRQLTTIKLLPHLMPNPKRGISKSEISNLFCPHHKTCAEADAFNAKFVEKYKETELILKPRMYLFGEYLNLNARLHIADKNYTIDNPVTGFEILLKCFLALNCKYPVQTQHIWQFVQKEVFDIDTKEQKQSSAVDTFIQDIRIISIN